MNAQGNRGANVALNQLFWTRFPKCAERNRRASGWVNWVAKNGNIEKGICGCNSQGIREEAMPPSLRFEALWKWLWTSVTFAASKCYFGTGWTREAFEIMSLTLNLRGEFGYWLIASTEHSRMTLDMFGGGESPKCSAVLCEESEKTSGERALVAWYQVILPQLFPRLREWSQKQFDWNAAGILRACEQFYF